MRLKVIKKLVDINILYSSQKLIWLTYERSKLKSLEKVNVSARVPSSYIFLVS